MLSHAYDYRSVLETSQKVNWKLEEVIGGRTLDFSRPFLPESLAGLGAIRCLNPEEKRTLNQIRGFTYLHLFGLVEEYIVPSLVDHVRHGIRGNADERRALLHFAEEEAKHIQLFQWFGEQFQQGFGSPCGVIGPPEEIAAAILDHSPLGVFITTLHIEWMTQSHYVDSVKDNAKEKLDPLFCSMLKHHWLEESQHAKLDTLVVDEIATRLERKEIEKGIDDYMDIGSCWTVGSRRRSGWTSRVCRRRPVARSPLPSGRDRARAGEELPLDVPPQRDDPPQLRPEPPRAEPRRSPAGRGAGARHRLTPTAGGRSGWPSVRTVRLSGMPWRGPSAAPAHGRSGPGAPRARTPPGPRRCAPASPGDRPGRWAAGGTSAALARRPGHRPAPARLRARRPSPRSVHGRG